MTPALRDSRDLDIFQLAKLLGESGPKDATVDLGKLAEMVRGSTRVIWAGDGSRILAFGSSLTDGAVFGLVTHLVVSRDCRRHGIGTAILACLMDGYKEVRFGLRAPEEAAPFCKRVGFVAGGDAHYYKAS